MAGRKSIVICGAGDWVSRQYAPALEPYQRAGDYEIWITFDSTYANRCTRLSDEQRADYNRAIERNVSTFHAWGAKCLDVSNECHAERLGSMTPHVAFIVTPPETHCAEAERWLQRAAAVVVEKPLDVDLAPILHLSAEATRLHADRKVFAFDHYLVRADPFIVMWQDCWLAQFLEEQIHTWRFDMLETCSDDEIRRRVPSLQAGMVMDLCSHGVILLPPVGDPATIQLESVKAATYAPNACLGVTTSGREVLVSGMETFAEIAFTFTSLFESRASGLIRVGKFAGLRDEKCLEIVGGKARDRRVVLDFVAHRASYVHDGVVVRWRTLCRETVSTMVRAIVAGRPNDRIGLVPPKSVYDVVKALLAFRAPIVARVTAGRLLDEYVAGTSGQAIAAGLQPL